MGPRGAHGAVDTPGAHDGLEERHGLDALAALADRWWLLDSGAADGATNMAVDHALLDRAAAQGDAVLRIYGWSRPTVSLGMHERTRFSREALAAHGVDVVRRPTGGRALLHDREVTYSVTAPVRGVGLGESYRAINALLRDAMARLGVRVTEAPRRARASPPDGAVCFAEPNAGELMARGGKLVGSAQRRDETAMLQHGAILLADDQARLVPLRAADAGAPSSIHASVNAATLCGLLGRPVAFGEVRDALVAALSAALGTEAVAPLDDPALRPATAAHRTRYASDEWTWRRESRNVRPSRTDSIP